MTQAKFTQGPAGPSRIGVLVGDDEPAIRRLICRMLDRTNFEPYEAASATDGLSLLRIHPEIRLAVIDMVMPGISGLDLAAEVNRRRPEVQILYITGHAGSIAIQAIAQQHPASVLLKPFTQAELAVRLEALLKAKPENKAAGAERDSWQRLIESSDLVQHPSRVASYRDTSVAYSIAAAHAAILRKADIVYQFAHLQDVSMPSQMPFELVTSAEYWRAAVKCISVLGLSADIAIAA